MRALTSSNENGHFCSRTANTHSTIVRDKSGLNDIRLIVSEWGKFEDSTGAKSIR